MESVGESDVSDGACPSVKEQPTECSYRIISGAGANSPFLVVSWKERDSDGMGWSRRE